MELNSFFLNRLAGIIPPGHFNAVVDSFGRESPVSVRINTLKIARENLVGALARENVKAMPVSWCADALILEGISVRELSATSWVREGQLYIQGLSSMVPALALDPRPGERVLDMCAAPGSKASQIAALMRDEGELVCLENIRKRYYKLKSVLDLLGVGCANVKLTDARRYRDRELFDRILVDAPCSSEGRFKTFQPKTFAYWSPRKIKEMRRKQRGLLLHASRLLKKDGTLIYATCTFAPEENEAVVDWLLRKTGGDLDMAPVALSGIERYPALTSWEGRSFDPRVRHAVRILPTEKMEGFFVAKMVKKG